MIHAFIALLDGSLWLITIVGLGSAILLGKLSSIFHNLSRIPNENHPVTMFEHRVVLSLL